MILSAPIYRLKREAKRLSREERIPLNRALDRIARREGFASWSLLAARLASERPSSELLAMLEPGDMVLLGARPGQGKTLLGLELIADAVRSGRAGVFFTLEFSESEARERLRDAVGKADRANELLEVDASDAIGAAHIIDRLRSAPRGTVAVIDYLQLLDQNRAKPPLAEQVATLKDFAAASGTILVFISQIDRSYAPAAKPLPNLADVRLPNPVDLGLFDTACFLNDGKIRVDRLSA